MEATIINYRGSKRTRYKNPHHMIIKITTIHNKAEAQKLLKKKVSWTTPTGKKITGEIVNIHGNSGAVRVHFERGLPGQSLGTKVEVL